jgi:hypothetical protein
MITVAKVYEVTINRNCEIEKYEWDYLRSEYDLARENYHSNEVSKEVIADLPNASKIRLISKELSEISRLMGGKSFVLDSQNLEMSRNEISYTGEEKC